MEEKSFDKLEEEHQALSARLVVEEDKARIAEYKKRYGADWRRILGKGVSQVIGGLKNNMHEPPTVMRPKI